MNVIRSKALLAATLWLSMATAGHAAQTFQGRFDDPANAALVSSDLTAPSFADDYSIANNVAIYSFVVAAPGIYSIADLGFGDGGADPYFTLFKGAGTGAAFVDSNFNQAFYGTGGDFSLSESLAAGTYQIALGTFANESFAENRGIGALADGFVRLGEPDSLGNYGYRVVVAESGVTTPVPEPSSAALMIIGLAWGLRGARRRASAPERGVAAQRPSPRRDDRDPVGAQPRAVAPESGALRHRRR